MRRLPRTLVVTALLATAAACQRESAVEAPAGDDAPRTEDPAAPVVDPARVRGEVDAVNRRFADALNEGDAAAAASVYTADARLLPPEMAPVDGREAIAEFWTGSIQQLGITAVQLSTDEIEVADELAYEQGRYRFDTNQGPAQGKYVAIWKRTPEGWRWHRYIWNPSPR